MGVVVGAVIRRSSPSSARASRPRPRDSAEDQTALAIPQRTRRLLENMPRPRPRDSAEDGDYAHSSRPMVGEVREGQGRMKWRSALFSEFLTLSTGERG